ncbi:MAG: threonine/serine dehydratase [Planctomycetota bacterium]|nr:threonine/serine dehydratase [Planctomycetota bacterium]MDA0931812.1 threonine/serine dehydratase [Planctomycetota bacterium]MDA1222306.1 threonine/serine dehydratase [Planctomycetota bacterium]
MTAADVAPPGLDAIRAARARLGDLVRTTPVWAWDSPALTEAAGARLDIHVKLELWQHAGSFKPRGALTVMLELDDAARTRGVTAFSAGNHALAVAYAAGVVGTTAKVVMPETANPGRIAACRAAGAEVVLVPTVHDARRAVEDIAATEGRTFVHPFEGPGTVLGTATLGLELVEQLPDVERVVVPIGGGGLCAGVAAAVKQLRPDCEVVGVEPVGADTMHRSFAAGSPAAIDAVRTMADSLGAPRAEPYTYAVCRRFVDRLVHVDDPGLARAMRVLFTELKLGVEPAGAATTAAALGPLARDLVGRRTALILCGANTDVASFVRNASADGQPS